MITAAQRRDGIAGFGLVLMGALPLGLMPPAVLGQSASIALPEPSPPRPTEAGPAATTATAEPPPPAETAFAAYQNRIQNAFMTPEERLACSAPGGSLATADSIVVCASREPDLRYRVGPAAVAVSIDPGKDSPVARSRNIMNADRGAPIGAGADMNGGASINPFQVIGAAAKALKAVTEGNE